jgi:hypothetical protein
VPPRAKRPFSQFSVKHALLLTLLVAIFFAILRIRSGDPIEMIRGLFHVAIDMGVVLIHVAIIAGVVWIARQR